MSTPSLLVRKWIPQIPSQKPGLPFGMEKWVFHTCIPCPHLHPFYRQQARSCTPLNASQNWMTLSLVTITWSVKKIIGPKIQLIIRIRLFEFRIGWQWGRWARAAIWSADMEYATIGQLGQHSLLLIHSDWMTLFHLVTIIFHLLTMVYHRETKNISTSPDDSLVYVAVITTYDCLRSPRM